MEYGKSYYETEWKVNEELLDRRMINMGFPENLIGTHMIREAVKMWRPGMMFSKELYPAISERFHSTPQRVERAMRSAIETAWGRGDDMTKNQVFAYSINAQAGKPTVSEFVARMCRVCSYDW